LTKHSHFLQKTWRNSDGDSAWTSACLDDVGVTAATPEPGSLTLLGLASFGGMAWSKKRKTTAV
jgi:hypothetical protein